MKNVKLNGRTTAELLIELSEAYGEIVANAIMFAEFKGNYNEGTVYKYGNIVRGTGDPIHGKYGSFIYINNTAAAGVNVGNSDYWFPLALDGDKGQDGVSGRNGKNGNSVESIVPISHSTVGDETVTKLRVNIENTSPQEIEVHAQNGQSVTDVVAGAPVEENGYTKTPISFFYNGSGVETVDVVAKNGVEPVAISLNANLGTLTEDQRRLLSNPNNYILYRNKKFYFVSNISGKLRYACTPYTEYTSVVGVITIDIDNNYELSTINSNCYQHTTRFTYSSANISPKTLTYTWYNNYEGQYSEGQFLNSGIFVPIGVSGGLFFASTLLFNNGLAVLQGIMFETPSFGFHMYSEPASITNFSDTVES